MNSSDIKEKVRWGTPSSELGNTISDGNGGLVKQVNLSMPQCLDGLARIRYLVAERDQAHVQDSSCLGLES